MLSAKCWSLYFGFRNQKSLLTSLAGELHTPPPSRDHSYAAPATSATMGVPAHYACNDEVTVASSSCQTDLSMADIAGMETKMGGMEESLRYYEDKQRITRENFVAHVTANDGNARYYTGMPSVTMLLGILNVVVECCGDITYWKGPSTTPRRRPMNTVNRRALSTTEEYIMTLARIKLGLDTQHLGYLFGIHATTVTRIFLTWTNILYCTLTPLLVWPDRATVAHHMPRQFRERYPNTRVIIDCTVRANPARVLFTINSCLANESHPPESNRPTHCYRITQRGLPQGRLNPNWYSWYNFEW